MFEGAESGEHAVLRAPALALEAAQLVLRSSGLSLTPGQVRSATVALHEARQALEAAHLHLVRLGLDAEPPGPRPGAATKAFLTRELGVGPRRARADVDAARATDPDRGDLPAIGGALASGEITREHVDVAIRTLAQLPSALVRRRGGEVDALLVEQARSFGPSDTRVLARHLLAAVAPDPDDRLDPDAHQRRCWSRSVDSTGMVVVSGQLDAAGGALYTAVLDHLSAPGRTGGTSGDGGSDGEPLVLPGVVDTRTTGQRYADAQVEMARLAASALGVGTRAAEPPRVVVHCTPEQLSPPSADAAGGAEAASPGAATCEQTGPLSRGALQRLACDAVVERVVLDRHGAVLEMRAVGRFATRAMRRALAARDGGCVWPGCSAPPTWCDAHHVVWWTHGGATELGNLALLCQAHHTAIHTAEWQISMRSGVPWLVPPKWVDPQQRPVRNTMHTAIAAARRAGRDLHSGEQLALRDAGPPAPAPDASPPPRGSAPPHESPTPHQSPPRAA